MAAKKQKLVIIGSAETAELAHTFFTSDTQYDVVAFSIDKNYLKENALFGLPIVPFEELENFFPPKTHSLFVAVSSTRLNRVRTRLYQEAKDRGYNLASYVSPEAFIGKNTELGENCFIFPRVIVEQGAKIGNNVILWSGGLIGHRAVIKDNCFLAGHVAIGGSCEIGENCFLGINSCTAGAVKIAKDCVVGIGSVVIKDAEESGVYVGNPAKRLANKSVEPFILGEKKL